MSDTRSRAPETDGAITQDDRSGETRRRGPVSDPVGTTDPRERNLDERKLAKGGGDESIPELLRRLTDQGTHLAQQQAQLVEAEVRSSVNDLKEAAGAMAGAAVVGIAGLGVLLMGLSFLLGEVMDLWLATLIVAAATLGGAYAMFLGGQKKLKNGAFSVERSRRTIERAPSAITGHRHEGTPNGR